MDKSSSSRVVRRIISFIRPYGAWVVLSLVFSAGYVFFSLILPILLGDAVDCVVGIGRVDFMALKGTLLKMVIATVSALLCQWIAGLINNHIVYDVTRRLRQQAFDTLIDMPLSRLDTHPHGDYVSRIANDADTFSDGLLIGFTQLFSGVLTIVGVIVFMLRLDVKIALVVILLTPLSVFVARFISSRSYAMFSRQASDKGEITDLITESVRGGELISNLSYEDRIRERFDEQNKKLTHSSMMATFYSSLTNPSTRFVNSLIYTGIGIFGALSCVSGGITVGILTSFLSYAREYARPFNEITGVITEMQNAFACATRLFEIMDEKREEDTCVSQVEPESIGGQTSDNDRSFLSDQDGVEGHIEFEDVSFSYDKEKKLIEHVSIDAKPGMKIAIVGPTGAGKTTLINLLMRFYDVDEGVICLDGRDITTIKRADLRTQLGMVLQETWLHSGTIIDNLRMGKPDATYEEVVEAATAAHAHRFISNMQKGYDTVLTQGGGSLSQGQRQLLCIARLMLALPPILILDEATSSIDTRTEMKIQDAFSRMMHGRTTFVVAHRLSTIRNSDLILYMENGNVVEQGTHEELLALGKKYKALYSSQFEVS